MIPCTFEPNDDPLEVGFPIVIKFKWESGGSRHLGLVYTTPEKLGRDLMKTLEFKERFDHDQTDKFLFQVGIEQYAIEKLDTDPLKDPISFTTGFYSGAPWRIAFASGGDIAAYRFDDVSQVSLVCWRDTFSVMMDLASRKIDETSIRGFEIFLNEEKLPLVGRHIYASETVDKFDFLINQKSYFEKVAEKLEKKIEETYRTLLKEFKNR